MASAPPSEFDGITPLIPPPAVQAPTFSASPEITEESIDRLQQQGFTRGLALSLNSSKKTFRSRTWVVDNSGSMQACDGHKLVATGRQANQVALVPSSRWEEIQECVTYHIQLAAAIESNTTFRLLNHPGAAVGPQQVKVASIPGDTTLLGHEVNIAMEWIRNTRPNGCTPLTQHILEFQREVAAQEQTLRANGQKVALVLATDGLPTDERGYGGSLHQEQFLASLRTLEGLPVWIIIRLCTDEDPVVSFYNELDSQLELSIEVLDDFLGEAQEVYKQNPWLTYGLPLQRMRELGFQERIFDLLDERPLTKTELRDFVAILFGSDAMDGVPDPFMDWDGFDQDVKLLLSKESDTWNPITKKMEPWINMRKLNRIYGDKLKCEICQIM
ncbi:expressed unknown protein [Seminavis robusta]|uniref:Uncharacterized protein n=1 Tax=Seminavis robusta TaxID=568900 RepID=A0A9N8HCV4_9STRA|nr:expressed unknown protein [Seminavis robusta]|eukprot:Sro318_g116000.1 n/a (387) ;mRNA; f:48872-50668